MIGYRCVLCVLLGVLFLIPGCIQMPQVTSVPGKTVVPVIMPATPEITVNITPTIVQPTFAPIRSISTITRTLTPKPSAVSTDPIVGRWVIAGNTRYQLNVVFRDDNTGKVMNSYRYIPIANEDITWEHVEGNYSFMRTYIITKNSDGAGYEFLYSYRTGELISEILPDESYLVKIV